MSEFFRSQLDYISFFYGLAFFLLVPVCLLLRRRSPPELAWFWLGGFGITHGAKEWLNLLSLTLGSILVFDLARLGLLLISFLCLAEFGRASISSLNGRSPGRWILLALVCLAALGGLAGLAGLFAATYVLGFLGGLWAAAALFLAARNTTQGSRQLQAAALGLVGYALATGLVVNQASFFPASMINYESFLAVVGTPIQLIRGLLALWISVSLFLFAQAWMDMDEESDLDFRSWFQNLARISMAGVILLLLGGWAFTQYLGNMATYEEKSDHRHEVAVLQHAILHEMEDSVQLVRMMAESPKIFPALVTLNPQTTQQANSILDTFSQASPGPICYLMDLRGQTLASSNRHRPDSFVGHSYAFRPYFQQALQGSPGEYWALGVTSKEMGYYASFPVRDQANRIVGVAVIKKSIREIEKIIREHYLGLIINPEGIVIMANQPDMVLRSLWPLAVKVRERLIYSRQFGEGPFIPLLNREPMDGDECLLQGKRFLVIRQPVPLEDWSIVIFGSMLPIIRARLLGISVALLVFLLFGGFLTIFTMTLESSARVARETLIRRNLERFLSPRVAELVEKDKGELVLTSERVETTVLFSDINGFTELSGQLDPQEVAALLANYFSLMSEIIFAHDGTLDKYLGDGLVAIFGAPFAYPDHPLKAVETGLAMLKQTQRFVAGLPEKKKFSIRIGINTGETVAGYFGSVNRMEYTAIGESVNIAKSLQSLAEPESIYLGKTTYDAVKHLYLAGFIGKIEIPKGRREIEIYQLS